MLSQQEHPHWLGCCAQDKIKAADCILSGVAFLAPPEFPLFLFLVAPTPTTALAIMVLVTLVAFVANLCWGPQVDITSTTTG